jgi:hypothetical protein
MNSYVSDEDLERAQAKVRADPGVMRQIADLAATSACSVEEAARAIAQIVAAYAARPPLVEAFLSVGKQGGKTLAVVTVERDEARTARDAALVRVAELEADLSRAQTELWAQAT